MSKTADYFTAALPEPWQILGLRLRPFSLGHYKLLRRFDCAFVSETEAGATREDLVLGVLICSMKPSEFLSFMESETFLDELKTWGEKCGVFDIGEKAKLFKDYVDSHSVAPKYWEKETGGSRSGAHWAQALEVTLRSSLGWTADEIDTQPLSKAFADYFKWAENQGSVQLMTAEEIAFIESNQKEATHGA